MRPFLLALVLPLLAAAAAEKPNVVLILADDLGYGDVHCYNPERGKLATPNLDRLAAEGMRFTDAHSSSGVCSPSRYTLLTGRYHWRSRLQRGIVGYLEEPLITKERLTLASLLKGHGYHSACIGKWHLGWDWEVTPGQRPLLAPGRGKTPEVTAAHLEAWREVYSKRIGGGPTERGFDEYFGTDVPNWPPYCFIENDRTVGIPNEFLPAPLLKNHLASIGGPALEDWRLENILPTLTQKACDYIGRRGKSGEPFFLYLPLTAPHTPLAVNEEWRGKSGMDNRAADLILETDAAVGRVLAALSDSGAAENTLVIFTSDNGFAAYVGAKDLEAKGHFPSGPLRGYKTDAWEGGHRVPFIVRWPQLVRPGTVSKQLVHHADVMATLAEIVGHDLPAHAAEDSFSLMPILRGEDAPVREHAISHSAEGVAALRSGPWKFIAGPESRADAKDGKRKRAQGQLYHLAEDLAESSNRFMDKPEMVTEMLALMDKLVREGRSTPGKPQANDVPVNWRRFLEAASER